MKVLFFEIKVSEEILTHTVIDVYNMFSKGEINPKITEISFDEIPEGIQLLEDNKVTGRLVAIMD